MIYKNFELFNVGELIPAEGGGCYFGRVPADVRDIMSDNGKDAVISPASVEIRFVINSGTAKIKLRSNHKRRLSVAYGGVFRGTDAATDYYGPEETTIEIAPCAQPNVIQALTRNCGYKFSPNVVRVKLERFGHDVLVDLEGDVRPPRPDEVPEKRFLIYGSSISFGAVTESNTSAYCEILARKLDCDVYNLGCGGSCLLEKEVCDYISEQGNDRNGRTWDFAILELGINTVTRLEDDEVLRRANYLLDNITAKNPGKKIFVTDIYYCSGDIGNYMPTIERRKVIEAACNGRDNVIYTPALTLLGHARGLSADALHPSGDGMYELAENWYKVIKKHI